MTKKQFKILIKIFLILKAWAFSGLVLASGYQTDEDNLTSPYIGSSTPSNKSKSQSQEATDSSPDAINKFPEYGYVRDSDISEMKPQSLFTEDPSSLPPVANNKEPSPQGQVIITELLKEFILLQSTYKSVNFEDSKLTAEETNLDFKPSSEKLELEDLISLSKESELFDTINAIGGLFSVSMKQEDWSFIHDCEHCCEAYEKLWVKLEGTYTNSQELLENFNFYKEVSSCPCCKIQIDALLKEKKNLAIMHQRTIDSSYLESSSSSNQLLNYFITKYTEAYSL